MNGKNIPEEIRRGLDARLEAMSTFGDKTLKSPALGTVSEEAEEFRLSREAVENCSPFIRMVGAGSGQSFYVMSGMFNTDSNPEAFDAIQSDIAYINTRPSTSNLTGAESYYELGKSEDIRERRFGYKEPGINNLSVTNLTDGAKGGAVKQAVVQFTVWRMSQLDEFQRYSFLSLGATVILDWGWIRGDKSVQAILEPPSIVVKEGDKVSLDFDLFHEPTVDGKTQASAWTRQSRLKYGDWDGLIGVVAKVDWKINEEGGFECEAVIQGKGSHAFADPIAIQERHNSIPPLYASSTSIQDVDSFRYAWMKKTLENAELSEEERAALPPSSLDEALERAKSGPEISLGERIASLDVEIIMKLFPQFRESRDVKSADSVATGSLLQEAVMVYTPYNKLDDQGKPTKKYATGVLSKDEETGEFSRNTQFQYDMWIQWGWFEDNVVSYYAQKFGDDAKGSAVFRSIQPYGDDISTYYKSITIANDPKLVTHTNDYILPGQTPENWIPEEVGDKKNAKKNPYKELAKFVNENTAPFAIPGNPSLGALRHIYVHINLIKSAFQQPGISISGGMLNLADSLNSNIKLWNFELQMRESYSISQRNGDELTETLVPAMYSIAETRTKKEYFGSKLLDPGQSYIFENNGLNSLIQSCDISTDISSRLGAAAYMGRQSKGETILDKVAKQNDRPFPDQEEVMNMARFYAQQEDGSYNRDPLHSAVMTEKNGVSSEFGYDKDRRFLYGSPYPVKNEMWDLDEDGFKEAIAFDITSNGLKNTGWNHDIPRQMTKLYPTALSARLKQSDDILKQVKEYGNQDLDIKRMLEDVQDGIKEEVKELNMYAFPPDSPAQDKIKSDDSDAVRAEKLAKYPYQSGLQLHFNWMRTLSFYLSENPVTSLLQESRKNDVTFLPIKTTITIDGIGGLNLLDMFRLAYLPALYKQEGNLPGTYFLIIGLNHTIDHTGWKTEITGQIQIDNDRFFDLMDDDTEEIIHDAMVKAFEELWTDTTDKSTSDETAEPLPDPKPEPEPEKIYILQPEDDPPIPFDPYGPGIHRIGDKNTRVVDQFEQSIYGENVYELFKYDNLDEFMSTDNLEVDTSVFDGKAKRFPNRPRGSGD